MVGWIDRGMDKYKEGWMDGLMDGWICKYMDR